MALADLQRCFADHLLSASEAAPDSLRSRVVQGQGAAVDHRLQVYHRAYRLRLLDVLAGDFPGLRELLGSRFEAVCAAYVEAQPSAHFNLRWYAAQLPAFLAASAQTREQPALAEMAALEWALILAFDAADASPVRIEDMAAIAPPDWADLRLAFVDALRVLPLRWNVAAIRRAVDDAAPVPALQALPEISAQAIWRQDLRVRHRPLPPDEAAMLSAARQGVPFGDLCLRLCDWHDQTAVALRAAGLLKTWIHDQWLAGLLRL